jgi:DNA-binding transcriptional ArsR family regulator
MMPGDRDTGRQALRVMGVQSDSGDVRAVLKIHFTAEDLARVRMTVSLGPTAETIFALERFGGRDTSNFRDWYKHVRIQLGECLPKVEQFIAEHPPIPSLLWLLGSSEVRATPDDAELLRVRSTISRFSRIAVAPYWTQIRGHLELERELRMRVAITKGFDGLLSTLYPGVTWKFPVLEIPGPAAGEVYLSGRGVLLTPSVFLMKKQCVLIESEKFSRLPAVVFPAPQAAAVGFQVSRASADGGNIALGALIGHSRAAVLEVLADGCTTGELSRHIGLSLAGASKHAAVLRQAGLVTTLRHHNTAFHVVTPLGQALLRGDAKGDSPLFARD